MLNNYSDILSIKDLMAILNIEKNTALRLVHNGDIASFRIGRCIKIPKVSVINYINKT